jgi:hypothetical protein
MPVTIVCPQVLDAAARAHLIDSVRATIKRWRPSFENWKLAVFRSQSGQGWDLAISGPRFRKVFTLYGPLDDLPGLVCAHVDAILAERRIGARS